MRGKGKGKGKGKCKALERCGRVAESVEQSLRCSDGECYGLQRDGECFPRMNKANSLLVFLFLKRYSLVSNFFQKKFSLLIQITNNDGNNNNNNAE